MDTNNESLLTIVNERYPLFFKDKEDSVVKMIISRLNSQEIEVTKESFSKELDSIINTEVIIPYITSPIRKHHIYYDILKVQDTRANYTSWISDREGFDEWRKKAPAITDDVCTAIVEENYPKTYNNKLVAKFILATLFQDKQDLTFEHFITQMKYLKSIDHYKNWTLDFQKDLKTSGIVNNLIYKIYLDAYFQTVRLSEYKDFDDEAKEWFDRVIFPKYGNDNVKKWFALFESRMHYKYPPFYIYEEPNGDIIFTREDRGIYDYPLPPQPSRFEKAKWKLSKKGFKFSLKLKHV
jgi:hypothetical protein